MKDKKLQIFVSSTYTDLIEERQAAVEAILLSGNIPAGMELFSAGNESQIAVIERWIDESDVYLLILGGRYGSIDPKTGKSYTQLEYEYAVEKKKPLFAVLISESALNEKVKVKGKDVLELDNPQSLKEFRSTVLKNLVKFWEDKKDIELAIHKTISDFSNRKDLIGWIRSDNFVANGLLAEEITKLKKENSELRSKLSRENNDNALYSQLTFEQMTKLLERKIIDEPSGATLLDHLIFYGSPFSKGINSEEVQEEIGQKLLEFRLIEEQISERGVFFKFTQDGHDFYLKALLRWG